MSASSRTELLRRGRRPGSPVLMVHGFPETWWTFHKLIPRLSEQHRVFAVDLRGFGDSSPAEAGHDNTTAAEDLVALIAHLDGGPVHLTGQDISGPTTFRVAATRPARELHGDPETGLPGFNPRRSPTSPAAAPGTSACWSHPRHP